MIAATPKLDEERGEFLARLILVSANPSDTRQIYALQQRLIQKGEDDPNIYWSRQRVIDHWLEEVGDPEFLVPIHLPKFNDQEQKGSRYDALCYLLRSRRKK